MSLLRKITGKEKSDDSQVQQAAPAQEEQTESTSCPHTALVPRWDSIEDMGKEDRATSFFCQGCERTFTPAEARQYMI